MLRRTRPDACGSMKSCGSSPMRFLIPLAFTLLATLASAHDAADIQISGDSDAITIRTQEATVREILSKLSISYDVQLNNWLNNSGALDQIRSGTYSGT